MTETSTADRAVARRDPVELPIRLRAAETTGVREHFAATDPEAGWDLARHPRVARLLRTRRFRFPLILPNQQIALSLRGGLRTVEGHVTQLLSKLGVSSRTEAAVGATRHAQTATDRGETHGQL